MMENRCLLSVLLILTGISVLGQNNPGCISGDCQNGYGTYVWAPKAHTYGDTYTGYWKNGLMNGYGTYVWESGEKFIGNWLNGSYSGEGTYYAMDGTVTWGFWQNGVFAGTSPPSVSTGCLSGDCQNGYGIYAYDGGGKYEGYFKNGLRDGEGTFTWTNGDIFIGSWVQGDYTGMGTYYYADGTVQAGFWQKNVYLGPIKPGEQTGCVAGNCTDGFGTYQFENGDKYTGNFYNYKQEGEGTYTWVNGDVFAGSWKEGKQNGKGKLWFATGSIQDGYWLNGVFSGTSYINSSGCISGDCSSGYGTYTWQSGEKYEGNWLSGMRNGQGINYYANGSVYSGNWVNDQQQGYGTYTFPNGDKYTGDWVAHKKDGQGTYTFSNGEKYTGKWKNDMFNGQGTYYYSDGSSKSGIWKDNNYSGAGSIASSGTEGCTSGDCDNGYGTWVFGSGEWYEGYWLNKARNGQGTNHFTSGATYTGNWRDDLKHGFGTYSYPSTSVFTYYQGYWTDDKMNGTGVLVYRNGQKYDGTFVNGNFEGEGTMSYPDGSVKAGIWKDNEYAGTSRGNFGCISGNCSNGSGTYTFESGEKYIGDFYNGNFQGSGTYYYANGDKYVGEFTDGKRKGQGTYTFSVDGRKYVGKWLNDKYDGQGSMYYSNGTIKSGIWKNGEFLGENADRDTKPVINWMTPEYFVSNSSQPFTTIKLNVQSNGTVNNAQIYLNGTLVADNITRDLKVSKSGTFPIERSLNLVEGENQIKIVVKDEYGTATSDIRTVSYHPSSSSNKIALVIGNGNYPSAPLRNPVNDATAIGNELKKLGFEVISVTNADRKTMINDIRSFGEKLSASKGTGLFYYAGHGMQVGGNNYLIPIDARIEKEQDADVEAVDLWRVMNELEYAQNDLNIVILDACRNNPFARSFRSGGASGLATTTAPQGTFIAYATAPGSVASDGSGQNGLYTQELLQALEVKGLKIEDMFKLVRNKVAEKSSRQQIPWDASSIFSDFYFNK